MPSHETLTLADTQPGPNEPGPNEPGPNEPGPDEPSPIQPIEPPMPDSTPEEFPFTEPKHYPIHPDIPPQPIHEPTPGRPIA